VLGRNENSLVRVLAGRIRCFFAIDVFWDWQCAWQESYRRTI
jgi:hypothetical protein